MNLSEIEKNLHKLLKNFSKEEFIFDLLLAYGTPKATITLLKKGRHNLSKKDDQIILKKKLFFQEIEDKKIDLHHAIDEIGNDQATYRHHPRFIVVMNHETILAVDTKTKESLDIPLSELPKHPHFFGPWAGMEKSEYINEKPADRKAAEKMARLYDEILKENPEYGMTEIHALNVFLSRLLFCFFAEDTKIFPDNIFTNCIASHTQSDGSDLHDYLNKLFEVLNTKPENRKNLSEYLQKFPYVNGGLFEKKHPSPKFATRSRKVIIECGSLDWAEINPDIFGSMIQAVVHPGQRGSLGMHYTSVPNIMKVINPLFLDDLYEEFEKSKGNVNKLNKLLERLTRLKIFDPACGSGNFLIIAYKELRQLEMKILEHLQNDLHAQIPMFSCFSLSQFYGIEIDDFAHEIALLSMYLAEHQMNIEFEVIFGERPATLPLKKGGNIVCGNATRVDWEAVCPKDLFSEIYILGNPPYLGARNQSKKQKEDMKQVLGKIKGFNNLDYISCWFYLASQYTENSNTKCAFVSTNSICQGSQVSLLWPFVLRKKLEIDFAHQSFKWTNNAKSNAGVTCVIVGLRNISNKPKYIFQNNTAKLAKNINAYLLNAENIYIQDVRKNISNLPEMCFGSMPNDNGNLLLNESEFLELRKNNSEALKFFKKSYGAQEFLKGINRYAIWIEDNEKDEAYKIPFLKNRIDAIQNYRNNSKRDATKKLAKFSYKFGEVRYKETDSIIVPRHSSERREYIPFGYLTNREIILDSALAIYNAEPWIFGIISSRMHMTWVRAVCGSLETRIRYSSALGYNTFPIPDLTENQKKNITGHVYDVLEEREKHPEKTMAQLYDPDKMPDGLREAHRNLDIAVEQIYRSKPFTSDEERLAYLFDLYERMVGEEDLKQ